MYNKTMEYVIENILSIIILSSLYSIVTVGFTLIYSVTKVMHLAQGSVVLISAYLFYSFLSSDIPILFSVLFTVAGAIILGVTLNFFIYERLRGKNKAANKASLIASIGIVFIIQNLLVLIFGTRAKNLSFHTKTFDILPGANINSIEVIIILTAVVSLTGLLFFMKKTRTGVAIRATADNQTISEVIGINTKTIRYLAMAIGSALAGISGILYALKFNIATNGSVDLAINAFVRAIIGGAGSIPGAVVGNLLIESAEHLGAWYTDAAFKSLYSFVIVFFFLLFMPRGIFGKKKD